jgi:hypothetical protein
MIQQSHSWGYTQRNATQVTTEAPAQPMLIAVLFTIASYENSQDVPLLMNGLRKRDTYTQWSFTQP